MKNSALKIFQTFILSIIVALGFGQVGSNSQVIPPNSGETIILIKENKGPIVEEEEEEATVRDQHGAGGSSATFGIKNNWPSHGKMIAKSAMLKWSGESKGPFEVTLKNDSATLYSIVTKKMEHAIPLQELDLNKGDNYYVQIASLGEDKLMSVTDTINLVNKKFLKDVLEAIESDETYQQSSDFEKEMIKAISLEQNGLKLHARSLYTRYRENHEDDVTARNMFTGYKSRTGAN